MCWYVTHGRYTPLSCLCAGLLGRGLQSQTCAVRGERGESDRLIDCVVCGVRCVVCGVRCAVRGARSGY